MRNFTSTLYVLGLLLCANIGTAQMIESDFFRTYGNDGKCYGRCLVSPVFDTIIQNVQVKQAITFIKEIPPVYDTLVEKLLVKPAHFSWEVVPPVYDTIVEKILVRESEEYVDLSTGANRDFRTVQKQIEIVPSITKWDLLPYSGDCESDNRKEDCVEWSPIAIPAEFEYLTHYIYTPKVYSSQMLRKTERKEEYKTVYKLKLVKPAELKEVKVLAQYETIHKLVLKESRRYMETTIPAEYVAMKQLRAVKEGGNTEAKLVLCATEYDLYMVKIQEALQQRGYDIGTIDGEFGLRTKKAIVLFQRDHGLSIGQLDFDTLTKLGVK